MSLMVAGACGSDSHPNPTAPTPPSPTAPTVTAVSVTSAAPANGTIQLTATARSSDGSSQDVTRTATWESSNTALATISATGLLTIVASGDVDARATYQGVSGAMHLTVTRPAVPSGYSIIGLVREIAPNVKPVEGAHVRPLDGTGRELVTDDRGTFALAPVPAGKLLIEITRDGYQTWESEITMTDRDLQLTADLYPTPPADASGATATARCNDGTWSWAQTAADACKANGGVAYTVCPGTLCTK